MRIEEARDLPEYLPAYRCIDARIEYVLSVRQTLEDLQSTSTPAS
jgi:transposase